jgi:hypothetical protein
VLKILKLGVMKIKGEEELFQAILRWSDTAESRADEAKNYVKLIRFMVMDISQVSSIFSAETSILSLEQQNKILLSLISHDTGLLPQDFEKSRMPRTLVPYIPMATLGGFFSVPYTVPKDCVKTCVSFAIMEKPASSEIYLKGFKLQSLEELKMGETFEFIYWVYKTNDYASYLARKRRITFERKGDCIILPYPFHMKPFTYYSIDVKYFKEEVIEYNKAVKKQITFDSHGLALHFMNDGEIYDISGLVFDKTREM